ncbi:MAG: menaquinol-cytochrome c reductase cytochrome b/c subunit [Solirubrobacteraceae bacterium]|nr:menaquinol-cytochrome c reductase cytochrome b/c subunit [Solirubrobacteraceae bacterium]
MSPRAVALACLSVLAIAGCGGDGDGARSAARTGPGAGARPDPQLVQGRRAVVQAGCLACHRIGKRGNRGPGSDLSAVGKRLTPAAIRRSLVNPTAPMPSYRAIARSELAALVVYLSSLRG